MPAPAALSAYDQSGRQPLTRRAQLHFGYREARIHRPHNGDRSVPVSCKTLPRTLRERLAIALRRRVGIGKSITPKQLAYALQLSQGTIDNLMNANSDPRGPTLMALLTFFDAAFANEILEPTGCTVAKLSDARAEALRKVAEGMAELRRLG